ncbi:MAG TPA: LysM peptidoglycan-binding domain-containing protein [Opitutaceae bacterium]|nr:LysM peptidoglycan-binding domain-containing protein [Opitutaceae bacterium]
MDTISRENNTSYLPIAGTIVGVIALIFAVVAFAKVSSVNKTLGDKIDSASGRIDTIESTANSAASDAQKAKSDIAVLHNSTQDGFNQVATDLGNIHASLTKLEEAAKAPPKAAHASKKAGAADEGSTPGTVSADGTYTIKSGDSLAKIARANGVTLADLEAANPGVDPKHLKVGQKINLPAKK